jgi:diguanylate cyclase (GGDEF)-like protein
MGEFVTTTGRSVLRSKLGLRLAMTVFLSIAAVEAVILVPSYLNYERDLMDRLAHVGNAAVMASFTIHAHANERDLGVYARILISGSDELTGIALYRDDGTLIVRHGEMPSLLPQAPPDSARKRSRIKNGGRMDVAWTAVETGLPFSVVGRLDSTWIGEELTAFVWRILGIVLLLSVVACGATMMIFDKLVLAPVLGLRDRLDDARVNPCAADAIDVDSQRTDELGEVMRAFNDMKRTIATNISDLRRAHETISAAKGDLEERVRERTHELREANATLRHEVAERERIEEQLRHDAYHDRVTGLANRTLLLDRVEHAIQRMTRDKEKHFSLLVLNLDRFRVVNESLGHHAGDTLLLAITTRLNTALRPGDTIARLEADEFAVLVEDTASPNAAIACAERVFDLFKDPITIDGEEVYCSFSMGICASTQNHGQGESMMQDAKLALARAKATGSSCYVVFESGMRGGSVGQLRLESDLRRAIEAGDQLRAHYQPIVEAGTGQAVGFETLLRWQHPDRGLIGPVDFIGLAEDSGLIVPIGRWVLETAARQIKAWRALGTNDDRFYVSVNVSTRQLTDGHLVEDVARVLEQSAFPPRCLKLEVTESLLMANPTLAADILGELKALGVGLAIDDFGTGYSSLSYLRRFPFDVLKIDRAFVVDMATGTESREIIRTVVNLAEILNMDVVAEGAETAEQVAMLESLGCHQIQGYYFGKPCPADEASTFLDGAGKGAMTETAEPA